MNTQTFLRAIVLILASLYLTGCSYMFTKSEDLDDQETKDSILVYGYIDDSEAPFVVKEGYIKQVRPAIDEPYLELRCDDDGLFYLENLPVGSYKLINLEGPDRNILSRTLWETGFPEPSRDPKFKRTELRAKKPGLYYLGAYKLDLVKEGGFFSSDKYEMVVIEQPSERDVLAKLQVHAKGTRWESAIKQRISRLK